MAVCGIYKIVNKVNGRYYVGSSKDIFGARWSKHQRELDGGTHHNAHLMNAWRLYGRRNFEVVVVEEVREGQLHEAEQRYLDVCAENPEQAYNANYDADGGRPSSESIEKIRMKLRGRVFTVEHRRRIGVANSRRGCSVATRERIGRASALRVHSGATCDRISSSLMGHEVSGETRDRMSIGGVGKHNHVAHRNPRFDAAIRVFCHGNTGERFVGTRFDFIARFGLSAGMVSEVVRGKRELVKGWRLDDGKPMYQTDPVFGH